MLIAAPIPALPLDPGSPARRRTVLARGAHAPAAAAGGLHPAARPAPVARLDVVSTARSPCNGPLPAPQRDPDGLAARPRESSVLESTRPRWPIDTMQVEATELLLQRIRAGDARARQALYDRCLPLLLRWAHGRLPHHARSASDTDDLVQTTLLRALRHLEDFQASGTGAFLAYLRQILLNEVRREIRSQRRHGGGHLQVDELELADAGQSVVELMVSQERLAAYERALARLDRRQQELVVLRIEFGLSYPEIAAEVGGTPDAVRMAVTRALQRVAAEIGHG